LNGYDDFRKSLHMVENYVGVVVELDGLRKSKEEEEWMKNL